MSNDLIKKEQSEVINYSDIPRAQTSEASALMTLVERMATSTEIDPDRVDRAFDMYMKVRAMDSEAQFNYSMAQAQSEIQSVVVNKDGYKKRYSYADLSKIHEQCKPIWTKHGFSVVTKTGRSDLQGHIKVFCDIRHSGGHKEHHEDDWPLDTAGAEGGVNKTAIQGKGSTTSYARRYTECMIFDISIKGEDDDGGTLGEPISADQSAELKSILQKTNSNVTAFLKFVGAKDVDSMTPAQYKKGMDMLDKKAKKDNKKGADNASV